MKIYLARWLCLGVEDNLERVHRESEMAEDLGAEMVVFPELFLTGYSREVDVTRARGVFSKISSRAPGTLFIFGSLSVNRRNRVTVWLDGLETAAYDKVHLFAPNGEFDLWEPGDRYVAFNWNRLRVGLMNCNDIRFPEQARALKLEARCDLLVVPAWWPWRRDHIWSTLLQARAAENQVWTIGCCIAGSSSPAEEFAGAGNHVFDPAGEPVRTADDRIYELDLENPPPSIVDPLDHHVDITRVEVMDDIG